jgi:CRP-like cAMP-binding protein
MKHETVARVTLDRSNDIAALKLDPLFEQLPPTVVDELIGHGHFRALDAGEVVHRKHDPSLFLHRVMAGAVRISSASIEGRETIFNYYGPGDWFGHIGLLDGQPRTHDIHACGPCVLFNVRNQDFQQLLAQYPQLYKPFTLLLCQMVRRSFVMLEDHALLTLVARLAKHLVMLSNAYGIEQPEGLLIDLHLPQEDFSMLLGSTRQTINRKLAEWAKLGWIKINYSEITICNRDALVQLYQ